MTAPRPSTLRQSGERLRHVREARAPFLALAVLLLLAELLLPSALMAQTSRPVDAFGPPLCTGLVGESEDETALPHCPACCPQSGMALPAPPIAALVIRFAQGERPVVSPRPVARPAPLAAGPGPRGPPVA